MKGTARKTLQNTLHLISNLSPSSSSSKHHHHLPKLSTPISDFLGFKPFSTTPTSKPEQNPLLEKLRLRKLKGVSNASKTPQIKSSPETGVDEDQLNEQTDVVSRFEELGLSDELIEAMKEIGVLGPSEIQCVGIPALLEGKNVVLGSDVEFGSTLAYLLPIIQLLKRDKAALGLVNSKRPQSVVLCPTMELADQVLNAVETIRQHLPISTANVSSCEYSRPRQVATNEPTDIVVGTPSIVLQQINEGGLVYDDIKYLVLDNVDTMFDIGLGTDVCKFLGSLKEHGSKHDGQQFQVILVISSVSKMINEQSAYLVERIELNNSGKVAAILLEMDTSEVFDLAMSPENLKKKVTEAIVSVA